MSDQGSTAPDITFGTDGAANFNVQEAAVNFRVATNNKPQALFIDGTNDQVLILSGGAAASVDEATGGDVNLFVSGTVGSQGTAVRGTSLFSGDIAVSGTLVAKRSDDGAHPAIKIDKNYTGTGPVGNYTTDASGLLVDYDVTGIVEAGETAIHDAISVNYNQDSPTMAGTIEATGADIRMTGGTSGAQSMKGVNIVLTGADTNTGIDITVPNDGTHIIARSPDSLLDHFKLSVGAAGATTLSTSDVDAAEADLTLTIDGDIVLGPASSYVIPDADNSRSLGSPSRRWANVYTGDLHLRNDRGNWTIQEEEDMLVVVNNITGQRYKMMLEKI